MRATLERAGIPQKTVACVGPTDKRGQSVGLIELVLRESWSLELLFDTRSDVRQERGQVDCEFLELGCGIEWSEWD
jgi:hypothetical protein